MLNKQLSDILIEYKNGHIKLTTILYKFFREPDPQYVNFINLLEIVSLKDLGNITNDDLYYLSSKLIDNNFINVLNDEQLKTILNTLVDNHSLSAIHDSLGNMGSMFINKCIEVDPDFYAKHKKEIIDSSEKYNLFDITNPVWMKDLLDDIIKKEEIIEMKIYNSIIDLEQIASTNTLKSIINWFHLLEQNNVYIDDFFNEKNLYELASFSISGYDSVEGSKNLITYTNFLLDNLNKKQITLENTFKYANSDPDAILKLTSPCLFEKLVPYMLKVEYPFCEKIVSATEGKKMYNFEVLLMAKTENDKHILADKLGNTQNNKMNIKRI